MKIELEDILDIRKAKSLKEVHEILQPFYEMIDTYQATRDRAAEKLPKGYGFDVCIHHESLTWNDNKGVWEGPPFHDQIGDFAKGPYPGNPKGYLVASPVKFLDRFNGILREIEP